MNKDMIRILEMTLERGFETMVLTNAMKPMMRPRVQKACSTCRSALVIC